MVQGTKKTSRRTPPPPHLHPLHHRLHPTTLPRPLHLPHTPVQTGLRILRQLRLLPARRNGQVPLQQGPPFPNRFHLSFLPLSSFPPRFFFISWSYRPHSNNRHRLSPRRPKTMSHLPNRQTPHQLRPTHASAAYRRVCPGHVGVCGCVDFEAGVGA